MKVNLFPFFYPYIIQLCMFHGNIEGTGPPLLVVYTSEVDFEFKRTDIYNSDSSTNLRGVTNP